MFGAGQRGTAHSAAMFYAVTESGNVSMTNVNQTLVDDFADVCVGSWSVSRLSL